MIDCHGRLVTSSRLLHTVEQERKRKIHEKRLETINKRKPRNKRKNKTKKPKGLQAGINNYIEKGNYQHILDNKKGKYMKEREAAEVKRINKLLLGSLQKVFASDSPFDEIEPEFVQPRSLNITSRRKELIRINMENRSMLRRLQSVEPTMSARRLADEDRIRRKDRKRLQNFIPTVDIYIHSQSIAKKSGRSLKKSWNTAGVTKTSSRKMPAPPKRSATRPRKNKPITKGGRKIIVVNNSVLKTSKEPKQEEKEKNQKKIINVDSIKEETQEVITKKKTTEETTEQRTEPTTEQTTEETTKESTEETTHEIIRAGKFMYRIVDAPEMIPVGFQKMVNDASNHKLIVRDNDPTDTRIVVIGSGFHLAVALTPLPVGVTPDIKGPFNSDDQQGKMTFASLEEICISVNKATSVKIRKNPIDQLEKECDPNNIQLLNEIKDKRSTQLKQYQSNFVAWLKSLSDTPDKTQITFIRNVYPKDPETKKYISTNAKPVWCTGLDLDLVLDCGSGKLALVDGVLGTQLQNVKWNTDLEWTDDVLKENVNKLNELVKGRKKTVAYGTGNWRKPHMINTWPKFQQALKTINVDFNLLPGKKEAKFGGISSLKLAAPYVPQCNSWIVVEMGGGSTQITRFAKVPLQNNEPLQMESFPPSVQIESIENKAIANFIQLVAKDKNAITVTYLQLLKGILFNADVRSAWNAVPDSKPITVNHNMFNIACIVSSKLIGISDLMRFVVANTENELMLMASSMRSMSSSLKIIKDNDGIISMFQQIDQDNDGIITYHELLNAIETSSEMKTFIQLNPSLLPFLEIKEIKLQINNIVVDSIQKDQLTENTFYRFATAIINHVAIDVQTYKENVLKLDAIDTLFMLLDTNKDGILSYEEIIQGIGSLQIEKILKEQPSLKELFDPKEMKEKMRNITKSSPDGQLNKGAFRLFVALQETPDLGSIFGNDGEEYGDDY